MILSVREDLGANCTAFSRRHPLSCWLSSMVVCFAGSLLANFLLGEPMVAIFKRQEDILLVSSFRFPNILFLINFRQRWFGIWSSIRPSTFSTNWPNSCQSKWPWASWRNVNGFTRFFRIPVFPKVNTPSFHWENTVRKKFFENQFIWVKWGNLNGQDNSPKITLSLTIGTNVILRQTIYTYWVLLKAQSVPVIRIFGAKDSNLQTRLMDKQWSNLLDKFGTFSVKQKWLYGTFN
jgi:hypothetical protein